MEFFSPIDITTEIASFGVIGITEIPKSKNYLWLIIPVALIAIGVILYFALESDKCDRQKSAKR